MGRCLRFRCHFEEGEGKKESWQLAVGSWLWGVLSAGCWVLREERELAVGSWQLAVGSWQWAVGSGQLAVGSGLLAVGSWEL